MTLRTWTIASIAIVLSGALHAAIVGQIAPARANLPDLSAGGGVAVPLLGDSFADMAAGGAVAPVQPVAVTSPAPVAVAAVPVTASALPVVPLAAKAPPPEQAKQPQPEAAKQPQTAPVAKLTPVAQQPQAAKNTPKATAKETGTAARNAKAGAAQGQDGGTARTAKASQTGRSGDGGAAAASYGSSVLRKIAKTRKAKSPAKGRVVIGFVIAPNGALQSAQVVRSSGNAGLDKVALDHIHRAAPFPAPPPSAKRQFAFEFLGKG